MYLYLWNYVLTLVICWIGLPWKNIALGADSGH